MIANDANINEHTDPKIVIAGLRQQIDMLKAELRATGKEPDEPEVPLSVDDLAMYIYLSAYLFGMKFLKAFSAG